MGAERQWPQLGEAWPSAVQALPNQVCKSEFLTMQGEGGTALSAFAGPSAAQLSQVELNWAPGSVSLDLLPSPSSAVIHGQRWPRVSGNTSCSSFLAPKNCCSLSRLERGSWGCVAHLLGPLLRLCPLRRPPFWKSNLASRCTSAFARWSPSS